MTYCRIIHLINYPCSCVQKYQHLHTYVNHSAKANIRPFKQKGAEAESPPPPKKRIPEPSLTLPVTETKGGGPPIQRVVEAK